MDEQELELLLSLDGVAYEMAQGVIVEFTAVRTAATPERPHGIGYALVLRPKSGGSPWVKFDNAHSVGRMRQGFRRKLLAQDHWHRTEKDKGRPYEFTTVSQLLDDFWREVKRTLDEKDIPNDL
jgi:Family of unknown function (DUF6516)